MTDEFHPCVIEQSKINGNFTIWLPEQEGLIEWIEEKQRSPQGYLWQALIQAASKLRNVEISGVYVQPEGDVFVAYSKEVDVLISMASLINELIDKKTFMLKAAEYAETNNYFI